MVDGRYTVAQIAEITGYSTEHVRKLAAKNTIPCFITGPEGRRQYAFDREAIDQRLTAGRLPIKPRRSTPDPRAGDPSLAILGLHAEIRRLETDLASERQGRALAEAQISHLLERVERLRSALTALIEEPDPRTAREPN